MMRILWLVRPDLQSHPGGDTTQILQTAAALRRRGIEIEITSDRRPALLGYDLAHLWHLDRLWENDYHAARLREAGLTYVLSTIYWPHDEFDRAARAGVQGRLARFVGSQFYASLRVVQRAAMHAATNRQLRGFSLRLLSFRRAARTLLNSAAVILPNSDAERAQIENVFHVKRRCVVVPNAADTTLFKLPPGGVAPVGVLCVGRIEPRKNQLNLVKALNNTEIPLTLVGPVGRYSRRYAAECRAISGANVRWLEARSAADLVPLYQRAVVHACVSWYETPGLASLEAALCGCAIVSTPTGGPREYFGDQARYCDPARPADIRSAVMAALAAGPPAGLAERVRREFTWEAAADRTLAAYNIALGGGAGSGG